jgi:hypothetical protein
MFKCVTARPATETAGELSARTNEASKRTVKARVRVNDGKRLAQQIQGSLGLLHASEAARQIVERLYSVHATKISNARRRIAALTEQE